MTAMLSILQDIVSLLTGAIVGIAQGIGTGIQQLVTYLMFTTDATTNAINGLSPFGMTIAIFGGISLAIGLSYKLYNFIVTLGGKR